MSDSTRDMLHDNMTNVMGMIQDYARQISSGEYGGRYEVSDVDGESLGWIDADSEDNAVEKWNDEYETDAAYAAECVEDRDEPTVGETPIGEFPLAVVDERGRNFAIQLSVGGPHIEVEAEGLNSPKLVGYWGGETVTMHDSDALETFMDHFIERDAAGDGQY